MCGILFCLSNDEECCKAKSDHITRAVTSLIKRRGPDDFNTKEKVISDHGLGSVYRLTVTGAVLHLRGLLTPQPLEDEYGNVLVWNGEIFGGINIPENGNDTSVLSCLLGNHSDEDSVCHVLSIMSRIQGPWSFVYYQPTEGRLWFGRDYFGRRSLVWHLPTDEQDIMAVSSVAERSDDNMVWEEVPADGIYCLESKSKNHDKTQYVEPFNFHSFYLKKFPWTSSPVRLKSKDPFYLMQTPVLPFNMELPSESDLQCLEAQMHQNGVKEEVLCSTLPCETTNIARVSETTLKEQEISDNSAQSSRHFEACAINKDIQTKSTGGTVEFELKKVNSLKNICNSVFLSKFETKKNNVSRDVQCSLSESFCKILGEAVRKRVFNLPREQEFQHAHNACCAEAKPSCSNVGILFSGGIDSIVLAVLADRFVPKQESIDLINVAFEQKPPKQNPTNKRKAKQSEQNEQTPRSFDVPDRLTGRSGVLELAALNPARKWNFIEVNVTLQDLQAARSDHITHLVSPLKSVLDDSIGCALWFAARGSGVLRCPLCIREPVECQNQEYKSQAKVLLVGMGADEQLGGYARHRTKFNQHGWLGLVEEMQMEVNRISERNLGRDDRCISDHGREARFPYLDEQVVSFLSTLPVWLKADLRLPRGTGEKLLLRQMAKSLGLTSSAVLPKRAIQFGSRIAKLESSREKGSDTCSRLNEKPT